MQSATLAHCLRDRSAQKTSKLLGRVLEGKNEYACQCSENLNGYTSLYKKKKGLILTLIEIEVMLNTNKTYIVEIKGKEYEFDLVDKGGWVNLSIMDRGGLSDMLPLYPEQHEWITSKLENIPGIEHKWPTLWYIETKNALKSVEKLFLSHGKLR